MNPRVGDLFRSWEHTYFYEGGSRPWTRIPRNTLFMILEAHPPTEKYRILLSDGRIGWLLERGFVEGVE